MHERYLHEGEQLLVSRRSSPAVLIGSLLRGLAEAIIIGTVLGIIIGTSLYLAWEVALSFWVYVALFVLLFLLIALQRIRNWNEARFRVTTERILIPDPKAFFHAPLVTVKWPQYQECEIEHRKFLDVLFLARPLKIRYGTADARHEVFLPSLYYAEDLKHYLDKVDAAVRKNEVASLKPFIAKRRGNRDESIST